MIVAAVRLSKVATRTPTETPAPVPPPISSSAEAFTVFSALTEAFFARRSAAPMVVSCSAAVTR